MRLSSSISVVPASRHTPMRRPSSLPTVVPTRSSYLQRLLWLFGFGTPFTQYSPLGHASYVFDLAPTAGATTLSYDPSTATWTTGPDLNVAKSFTSGSAVATTV